MSYGKDLLYVFLRSFSGTTTKGFFNSSLQNVTQIIFYTKVRHTLRNCIYCNIAFVMGSVSTVAHTLLSGLLDKKKCPTSHRVGFPASSLEVITAHTLCGAESLTMNVQAPWITVNPQRLMPPDILRISAHVEVLFIQLQSVLWFSFVLQFYSLCTIAHWCSSILLFLIAVLACAGCQSPSGSECSVGCCWDSAEGERGLSM